MSAIDQELFSGEAIYSHPTEKHRRSFIISESKELFFAKPPVILSLIKKQSFHLNSISSTEISSIINNVNVYLLQTTQKNFSIQTLLD